MSGRVESPFVEAIAALRAALDEVGAPFMLIGGLAVIVHGVARVTGDVDATIWAEGVDVDRALDVLARHRLVPRIEDAAAFARERQVLLLRHEPTGTPIDLSLAWLPFEKDALDRASERDFGGARIPVATAQDLVVYKAVAFRDRDRDDIARLLAAHRDEIDLAYVRARVVEFADALDEPERVESFDRLVARTVGD
jgi:hypothetical protein